MASSIPSTVKENTAIIIVPGSFTTPAIYSQMARQLILDGFADVQAIPLMSAVHPNEQRQPPAKIGDDTFYTREVIQAYLQRGRDIVLVMHSYGGFPGSEAIKGLPSRAELGKDSSGEGGRVGNIVAMMYVASFMPFPGDSLRSMMGDYLFEPLKSGDPGQYMVLPEAAAPAIFSDLAAEGKDEEIKRWFAQMVWHSSDSYDGQVTNDMWSDNGFKGRVGYVLGGNDMSVPPALAESIIEKVEAKAGKGRVKVTRLEKAGHCLTTTMPLDVVKAIEDLLTDS